VIAYLSTADRDQLGWVLAPAIISWATRIELASASFSTRNLPMVASLNPCGGTFPNNSFSRRSTSLYSACLARADLENWNHEHDLRSNWLLCDTFPFLDDNKNHRDCGDHHCDGGGCKCLIHDSTLCLLSTPVCRAGYIAASRTLPPRQAAHRQRTPRCNYPLLG
jgi:hypothetical protein